MNFLMFYFFKEKSVAYILFFYYRHVLLENTTIPGSPVTQTPNNIDISTSVFLYFHENISFEIVLQAVCYESIIDVKIKKKRFFKSSFRVDVVLYN